MRNLLFSLLVLSILTVGVFPQSGAEKSLRKYLFSPQLLRRHQHELQLTEEQRKSIVNEINEAQSQFTSMQWNLDNETRKLSQLVEDRQSDEASILKQLDVVLDLEKEIKRHQLILAVRIRNTLNEEQLRKLRNIRAQTLRNFRNSRIDPKPKRDDLP
jgi:Spy/CpxP family protein refolding chaperone